MFDLIPSVKFPSTALSVDDDGVHNDISLHT